MLTMCQCSVSYINMNMKLITEQCFGHILSTDVSHSHLQREVKGLD